MLLGGDQSVENRENVAVSLRTKLIQVTISIIAGALETAMNHLVFVTFSFSTSSFIRDHFF